MAKFKIGSGIKLEAQLPTGKLEYKEYPKDTCEAIARTQELNEKLEEMGASLSLKTSKNEESILEVMNALNEIDMRSPVESNIIQPEIKAVTIHKDHNYELKNIQDSIVFLEDQTRTKIKSEAAKTATIIDELNKALNKQKTINMCLGVAGVCSLILHII